MKSIFNKNIKKYFIIILLFIIGGILFLTNNIKNLLLIIEPLTNSLSTTSSSNISNTANNFRANNINIDTEPTSTNLTPEQEVQEITSISNVAGNKINKLKENLIPIQNSLEHEGFSNNNRNNVDPNIDNPCLECNHGGTTGGASIADQSCLALCNLKGANGID